MDDELSKPKRQRLTRYRNSYVAATERPDFQPDPDAEDFAKLVGALAQAQSDQAQSAQGNEPREVDHTLGKTICVSLQDKVKVMLEKAKDPKSDAALMVRVLLLNGVATMEGELSPLALKAIDQDLRIYNLIKQLERQRRDFVFEQQKHRDDIALLHQKEESMNQARSLATITRHQLDSGEEVDMRNVCGRIADLMGLRPQPE